MLEIEWAPMPDSEKLAILGILPDPWAVVGGDQDIEGCDYQIERLDLFTFAYSSSLSFDDFTFCRSHIPGNRSWIYFFDASLITGMITIAGLGEPSDETAILMYLRIAEQTCERLPEKSSAKMPLKPTNHGSRGGRKSDTIETFPTSLTTISHLVSTRQA